MIPNLTFCPFKQFPELKYHNLCNKRHTYLRTLELFVKPCQKLDILIVTFNSVQ